MQYLDSFSLPDDKRELEFRFDNKSKILFYTNNAYPLDIFPRKQLETIDFAPITLFYGGNGSGKSTLLNLIAECLEIERKVSFNKTQIFDEYVRMCRFRMRDGTRHPPRGSEIITSDGVFDLLLDTRAINEGNARRRSEFFDEYNSTVKSGYQMRSLDEYDELKRVNEARRRGAGAYVSSRVGQDIPNRSNGESAFLFFTQRIGDNALYLLDEPENSLSAAYQQKLAEFISDSARFYNCQFIISTHSPFLLSMKGVKIYDLDSCPAAVRKWSELENMRIYHQLFEEHKEDFD